MNANTAASENQKTQIIENMKQYQSIIDNLVTGYILILSILSASTKNQLTISRMKRKSKFYSGISEVLRSLPLSVTVLADMLGVTS